MAIVAFVLSFLLVLAPVGMILGIVALFRSRGRRLRGRGLAIAAIPIGLGVSVFTAGTVSFYMGIQYLGREAYATCRAFRNPKSAVAGAAESTYHQAAERLKLAVTPEAFVEWAQASAAKHGALQRLRFASPKFTMEGSETTFHYTGEFVNGSAHLAVTMGWHEGKPQLHDLEIDGQSPLRPTQKR